MSRVVAIHQPTFLPWLGWWDKLARSDVFVLLDDVQFPKKGGTWTNRVRILVGGEPAWLTVPVDRTYHGVRRIREMRIDDTSRWRTKMLRTIAANYTRAAHFNDVFPVVEEILAADTCSLAELNERGIRKLGASLNLNTDRLVRQSDLGVSGARTQLLVLLCQAVGASTYLTGDGAGDYLSEAELAASDIALLEQQFVPPSYRQLAPDHVAGLSIIDALMNCGWEETAALVARVR